MGKSIEDCLEAKEWVDLFDAIDVNKKGSLNMKGLIIELCERTSLKFSGIQNLGFQNFGLSRRHIFDIK